VKFEKGDVLFNKLRPYLAKGFKAEQEGAAVPEFLVLEPYKFHPDYLLYLLLSKDFVDRVNASTYGAKMPRASWDFIGDVRVPCPEFSKQKEIVSYLDERVSKLHEAVKKKEEMSNLLEEKREAIITEYVTKGLDPDCSFKESGIPTIGDVPAHWNVVPNRAVFEEVDIRTEDGSEELLTVSHKTGVTPRSEKDVNMFEADSLKDYKIAKQGDLVINTMWAWMGAVGTSPQLGLVSPSYHVYQPKGMMEPEYADILYRTPPYVSEMGRFSKGVWKSRKRLYPDVFLRMETIVPPEDEQKEIVQSVMEITEDIESTKTSVQTSIERLKEKHRTIVTQAVTGRIDVTETQSPELETTT